MNRTKHMNANGVTSDKVKVTKYSDTDTRYGFMIQDSDEYNTRIYPLGMKETCHSKNPTYVGDAIPQAVGCVGQRYENCLELDKHDKEYVECDFSLYSSVDDTFPYYLDNQTNKRKDVKKFVPKKINENSFIDKSRLSKIAYPNLLIDGSPDTYPNISLDISQRPEILEHCMGLGGQVSGLGGGCSCCGDCSGICKPLMSCCGCPSWVSPEYSCCFFIILVLLCVFFPCILSCCGVCAIY